MSESTATAAPPDTGPVRARLSVVDRWLPVWIIAAMVLGLALGRFIPGLAGGLDAVKVGSVSVPIAVGLLVMMYPVLAKVRYTDTGHVLADKRLMITSLVINWVLAPAFMFVLAWVFLPDLPEYRTGLIIVGLARCIAMVLIWNDLACADREAAAVLVAINSIFQVVAFGALGWFYLQTLPSWLGLPTTSADFSIATITFSVLVFLGIPLLAGFLTRTIGEKTKGRDWYENRLLPTLGPFALYGLLFTIVILFALQGHTIAERPLAVVRIAVPLLIYFVVVFTAAMVAGRLLRLGYPRTATLAFTAAGNNFELAIAVAIATFGVTSGQALAGVVGPLIEVPVLVGLVYVALWARRFYATTRPGTAAAQESLHDPGSVRLRQERLTLSTPTAPTSIPCATSATRSEPTSPRKSATSPSDPGDQIVTANIPSVLFVCVHNAGRSQMAAGYLTHLAGDRIDVRSAGSEPADQINPVAVAAMAEEGIDITAEQPKVLTIDAVKHSDVVITMGCGDTCPYYPGKRYEDWVLDDPASQNLDTVRAIRDQICSRVQTLISQLLD